MTWIHEVFIEIEKTAWWQVKIMLWWPCWVQLKRSMNSSADWIQARCSAYNHMCFSNHCRAQGHNHNSLEEHQGMNGQKSHSHSESSTFCTVWRSLLCSKHTTATPSGNRWEIDKALPTIFMHVKCIRSSLDAKWNKFEIWSLEFNSHRTPPRDKIVAMHAGRLSRRLLCTTVTTVTSDHPVPYCPIASTRSPSVYCMYSLFRFFLSVLYHHRSVSALSDLSLCTIT